MPWLRAAAVDARLLDVLRAEPYFALAPPKSTGLDLVQRRMARRATRRRRRAARLAAEDVQATLAELTASVCADACRDYGADAAELIVCGGGAFNVDLMARLAGLMAPTPVVASSERGLPPDQVEAAAFAWLARAFVERMPGNLALGHRRRRAAAAGRALPGRLRRRSAP